MHSVAPSRALRPKVVSIRSAKKPDPLKEALAEIQSIHKAQQLLRLQNEALGARAIKLLETLTRAASA